MALPLSLNNISYRVAGSSLYEGDLIITDELIYYFPHTELAAKIYGIVGAVSLVLLGCIGTVGAALVAPVPVRGLAKDVVKKNLIEPYTDEVKLERAEDSKWQAWLYKFGCSSLNFYPVILYPALWYPLILDSAMATLNENQSLSNYSIPMPTRFAKEDVKGIKLTALGALVIETEFDMNHKFRIGPFKKGELHKALLESHYMTQ